MGNCQRQVPQFGLGQPSIAATGVLNFAIVGVIQPYRE